MEQLEYYDGMLAKDESKEYALIKRIIIKDTLFLYYKSIEVDKEKEELKNKISELDDIVENLMLTIMDLTP